MGKIDEAIVTLQGIEDETERAFELAGLISTLFKIRGVALVAIGRLAFASYANRVLEFPELDLAVLAGKLTPRLLQEVMSGQLHAEGSIDRWIACGIPVRFRNEFTTINRDLCRDFTTAHGITKLIPAEEITAERILAAVYPTLNEVAHQEALLLLVNALTDAFQMNWTALHTICHLPEFRIGEELARMRIVAKQEADALMTAEAEAGIPLTVDEYPDALNIATQETPESTETTDLRLKQLS